jgi:hypothetical protein
MRTQGDILWLAALTVLTVFIFMPITNRLFLQETAEHPYMMGFVKFAILATMGEMLTIRIMKGTWGKPAGMGYKALVWGVVGLTIVLMFGLFNAGVQGATSKGLLPGAEGLAGRFLQAFFIGTLLNLTYGPAFMAAHRISDTYIDQVVAGNKPTLHSVVGEIDWPGFMRFVVGKTIPFFWIPVQTINFMLPAQYRVVVAAYLSIVLGIILAYARRK